MRPRLLALVLPALVVGCADSSDAPATDAEAPDDLAALDDLAAERVGIMRGGRLVRELSGEALAEADLEALYLEHMHGKKHARGETTPA